MGLQAKVIPDDGAIPPDGLLKQAGELRTALAGGKMRLFQSGFSIDPLTATGAQILAAEADFSGYAAGGVTVTAFNEPYQDDDFTLRVTSPLVQFNFLTPEEDDPVVNTIEGVFYTDAAGVVRVAFALDDPKVMDGDDDSIPVVMAFRVGTTA